MIKNYLKTAWRNLVRNKFSTFLNISGLAVGMAVAMLNGFWIWDELSFNKSHQNYEHIARVVRKGTTEDGKPMIAPYLPLPLADELKTKYAQYFDKVLLATDVKENILAADEIKLSKKGQFIEPGAPDMLTLKMLKGTRAGLQDQSSVMLSASAAKSLFGNAEPMGKLVKINTTMDAKVTGVYEDLPHNSEFYTIDFFAPIDLYASANPWVTKQGWYNHFVYIYMQLKAGVDAKMVSAVIKDAELNNITNPEDKKKEIARGWHLVAQPMSDWHLHSDIANNVPSQLVWMIGLIGLFVLLLACINFMNLSTARSEKRAKEVGIRKTIGSMRGQLIRQFFTESFLMVLLAFVLAIAFVILSLPWFNEIASKKMTIPWMNAYFWIAALACIVFTAIIAGIYPALYLSSFRPVKVLKGTFRAGRFAAIPRKALVTIQFTVSITLIIGTLIVFRQIQHARNRPMGYNPTNLLLIEKKTGEFYGKYELFRTKLKNTGVVEEMAESRSSTADITMWNAGFFLDGKEIDLKSGCGTLMVTSEYGKTVGWDFIAGRDFSRELTSDSSGLVINETFAKRTGLADPVGATLTWAPGWRDPKTFTVVGVVKDMVALSPYKPTIPTVFFMENKYSTWINIRLKPTVSTSYALSRIEEVFKELTPSAPFTYKFADDEYALKFASENRIGKLTVFFAVLAIFISCLGLFGLASFTAERRIKEIGIRKIIGASVFSLWKLLSTDFVILVIVSSFIAIPIAYYFLSGWLQQYEYHTKMSWWIFAMAIVATLLITLLTVSFQAIRAAVANPVKSLRTE